MDCSMRFSKELKNQNAKARWINTRLEYDFYGRLVRREGYWYKGSVIFAGGASSRGGSWRFSDDGTETGAVLLGTVNVSPSKGDLVNDTVYHLRFGIEEAAGGGLMNFSPQLQYNKNSSGWVNVDGSSSSIQSTAGGLVDGEDTVARSGVSQGEYTEDATNEGADEVDGIAGGATADLSNTGAEFVWSFQIIGANVSDGDTIEIRPIITNGGADLDFYDQSWPTITVEVAAGSFDETAALNGEDATIDAAIDMVFESLSSVTADGTLAAAGGLGISDSAGVDVDAAIAVAPEATFEGSVSVDADAALAVEDSGVAEAADPQTDADGTMDVAAETTMEATSSTAANTTLSAEGGLNIEQANQDVTAESTIAAVPDLTVEGTPSIVADGTLAAAGDVVTGGTSFDEATDADAGGTIASAVDLTAEALVAMIVEATLAVVDSGTAEVADPQVDASSTMSVAAEVAVEVAPSVAVDAAIGATGGLSIDQANQGIVADATMDVESTVTATPAWIGAGVLPVPIGTGVFVRIQDIAPFCATPVVAPVLEASPTIVPSLEASPVVLLIVIPILEASPTIVPSLEASPAVLPALIATPEVDNGC